MAADGAIQRVLAQRLAEQQDAGLGQQRQSIMAQRMNRRRPEGGADASEMYFDSVQVGELIVHVVLTPVSGLIDLNNAPVALLARLFAGVAGVAGVEEEEAGALAEAVVGRRTGGIMPEEITGTEPEEQGAKYETIEDLMRVQGIDRRIFEAVQDAVYVAQEGSAGVDWQSAPADVLRALGDGDESAAREIVTARMRGSSEQVSLPSDLDLSFQQQGARGIFRADAMVEVQGFGFMRRRWVDTTKSGPDGLPWTYFRTERLRGTDEDGKAVVKAMKERDAAI